MTYVHDILSQSPIKFNYLYHNQRHCDIACTLDTTLDATQPMALLLSEMKTQKFPDRHCWNCGQLTRHLTSNGSVFLPPIIQRDMTINIILCSIHIFNNIKNSISCFTQFFSLISNFVFLASGFSALHATYRESPNQLMSFLRSSNKHVNSRTPRCPCIY